MSLNRRVSAKKVIQLFVDPKRWCLFVKQTLNGYTGFQVKVYVSVGVFRMGMREGGSGGIMWRLGSGLMIECRMMSIEYKNK